MYTVILFYKQKMLYSFEANCIPPITDATIIDYMDEHYLIVRTVFQPEQKRMKVFLEKI